MKKFTFELLTQKKINIFAMNILAGKPLMFDEHIYSQEE